MLLGRLLPKSSASMALAGLVACSQPMVVLPTAAARCLCTRIQNHSRTLRQSFLVRQQASERRCMAVKAGQTDDGSNDPAQQQLKETAALDQLIDSMLAAKNQQEVFFEGNMSYMSYAAAKEGCCTHPGCCTQSTYTPQLTQVVATNLLQCNQRFWLRLATRSDGATSQEEKDQLSALSRTVGGGYKMLLCIMLYHGTECACSCVDHHQSSPTLITHFHTPTTKTGHVVGGRLGQRSRGTNVTKQPRVDRSVDCRCGG